MFCGPHVVCVGAVSTGIKNVALAAVGGTAVYVSQVLLVGCRAQVISIFSDFLSDGSIVCWRGGYWNARM